jgi:hypothetical protein
MTEKHWAMEFSVLFGFVFFVALYFSLKRLFGGVGELATATLAFFSAYLNVFTEIRMYSMVLAIAALLFYAVTVKFKGVWTLLAFNLSMLITVVHYLAALVPLVMLALYIVMMKEERRLMRNDLKQRPVLWLSMGWLAGVIFGLMFYLPQRARIDQMWIPASGVSSWPSSMIYSIFYTGGMDESVIGTVAFVFMLATFIAIFYYAFKSEHKRKALLAAMVAVVVLPLLMLAGNPILRLYHHRYFLSVMWLFAAAAAVIGWTVFIDAMNGRRWWRMAYVSACGLVVMVFLVSYWAFSTSELNMMYLFQENTPCENATVVHETPFTALPFKVWGREHECGWRTMISSAVTERQGRSTGFDALDAADVLYGGNVSVGVYPKGEFIYIEPVAEGFGNRTMPQNRTLLWTNGNAAVWRMFN